jgi:hypothetical protein
MLPEINDEKRTATVLALIVQSGSQLNLFGRKPDTTVQLMRHRRS